jgi:hypothetical protein
MNELLIVSWVEAAIFTESISKNMLRHGVVELCEVIHIWLHGIYKELSKSTALYQTHLG